MTPSRPYLIRALNDWINDNLSTPYIVVDAGIQGVQVPQDYVSDGQIVLNVSSTAVKDLLISNEAVEFSARFGGVPMRVHVPIIAVMAIYAKETGQGMSFGREPGAPEPPTTAPPQPPQSGKARPSLKVVK
ncbi:ClpXP protease specificity-enhancing factor [Motiliproteus sp. SC1-56]|uniref:ClpXP protease specificity-enhancing factor n=1 Tax=Motiliproteus sp. SC1-56 TaxID=2799565 RepID=UPI001A8FA295|nr:ClpXP protease specificity-enhancing factor [Motiliproteus sp. SC1-56]